MKIHVAQRGQIQRNSDAFFKDSLVDAFAAGIDHAIQVDDGADFEVLDILMPDRHLETVSRRM